MGKGHGKKQYDTIKNDKKWGGLAAPEHASP